jgi:uncharacterized protein
MDMRAGKKGGPLPESGLRRRLLGSLAVAGGLFAFSERSRADAFSGDSANKVVYQLNKFDPAYIKEILHSVAVVLRSYSDNVNVVVTCFGPGIWVLVKEQSNRHKLDSYIREMISSQSMYGVEFHACEQTMKTVKLAAGDLVSEATVVPSGAVDLIKLQQKNYAYIAW